MSFKILYVTATSSEADSLKNISGIKSVGGRYCLGNLEITLLVTGVGSMSVSWALKQWFSMNEKPDLAINGGIAGSFKEYYKTGDVVLPVTDCFADSGIEDGENLLTLFEAGLAGSDDFPFRNGLIHADPSYCDRLQVIVRPVSAITVNMASGSGTTINKLIKKFNPDIETMEGATFFYICAREKIPFLALRAISNRVEPRNRDNWNIAKAVDNLSDKLKEVLKTM
jgi:futalosine hydrolase